MNIAAIVNFTSKKNMIDRAIIIVTQSNQMFINPVDEVFRLFYIINDTRNDLSHLIISIKRALMPVDDYIIVYEYHIKFCYLSIELNIVLYTQWVVEQLKI